jgi:ABC-2 type transport system ATP-binding protein
MSEIAVPAMGRRTPAVDIQHLGKRYGSAVAVDDRSLEVLDGEIVGILGPNGAGKTTTVECVTGVRHPDVGSVRVFGRDPIRDRAVGVQLQNGALPDRLRVSEIVEMVSRLL